MAAWEPSAGALHIDALLSLLTLWCRFLLATAFRAAGFSEFFAYSLKNLDKSYCLSTKQICL